MRNFLLFAAAIGVLIVGGYLGYRVFVKHDTLDTAVDKLSNKVQVEGTAKDRAAFEKARGDYEKAIQYYQEGLAATPKPKIEDQRDMEWQIAECYYIMATQIGRTAKAKTCGENAIKAYQDYIKKYPTDPQVQRAESQIDKLRNHPNLQ